MQRKNIFKVFTMLFLLFITGLLSACCGAKTIEVKVVFKDVDPRMGVESYVKELKIGSTYDIDFIIPEGYTDGEISATRNGKPLEITITDEERINVDKESPDYDTYRYILNKSVSYSFKQIVTDIEVIFDMSTVKKQQFAISFSDDIINKTKTEKFDEFDSNITLLSINPEAINDLRKVDDSNIVSRIDVNPDTRSAIVDYGEQIVIWYDSATNREIETFYAEVTHFTPETNIATADGVDYAYYDVATSGNQYYGLFTEGFQNQNSRLFYLGKIQEDISLLPNIPNYQAVNGFVLENNKNKFAIITNQAKYNSDLLSIEVFAPTDDAYVSNSNMETVDIVEDGQTQTVNLKRIDLQFDADINGDFVKDANGNYISDKNHLYRQANPGYNYYSQTNSEQVYQYLNRYDVYNFYLGEDKTHDELLSSSAKELLSDEIFIKVSTNYQLSKYLNFNLLQEEKQETLINPYDVIYNSQLNLAEYKGVNDCIVKAYASEEENVGYKIIRINRELIECFQDKFLATNTGVVDGQLVEFETGNAIFYAEIDPTTIVDLGNDFKYTEIFYPTFYGGEDYFINHTYNIEAYINEAKGVDGQSVTSRENRNYGFVDLHKKGADFAYFYTNQLLQVEKDEFGNFKTDGYGNYIYIIDSNNRIATYKNINVDVYGVLQDPLYYSKLETLSLLVDSNDPGAGYRYSFKSASGGVPYAGYISFQDIDLYTQKNVTNGPFVKTGYSLSVHLGLAEKNYRKSDLDFSGISFVDSNKDAILMTNDIFFENSSDFVVVDAYSQNTSNLNVKFGSSCDIYYLIANSNNVDFDLYHYTDEGDLLLTKTKVLKDIAGNEIEVEYNNRYYKVYVKYQDVNLYTVDSTVKYYTTKKPT